MGKPGRSAVTPGSWTAIASWSIALGALGALGGGCFGDGPVPGLPEKATILYTVSPPTSACSVASYIGPAAIGPATDGYVLALPYFRDNRNCDNGGSQPPQNPVNVQKFHTAAPGAEALDPPFISDGLTPPRVSSRGVWAYKEITPTNIIQVAPAVGTLPSNPGDQSPAGIVADDTSVYVASWSQTPDNKAEVNNPNYPCCGAFSLVAGGGRTIGFGISKLPRAGGQSTLLPVSPLFACESMSECLVGNTSSLFYMAYVEPAHVATVTRFPKTGTSVGEATTIGTVENTGPGKIVPVGLAADDAHVVWSASVAYEMVAPDDPQPQPLCVITAQDLATQATTVLLSTTEFSCMHASIAGGFVYFAIVSIAGARSHMHGDGVGRVSLTDQTFESLALGVGGDGAGPRRVYVVDHTMYLVDPFAVAAVETSTLDGTHDFAK